ncbi:enoyl-CoA hydratase [Rhodothalassium salexigens DSM 2132]|uniref:Enoyl-CoA hydratase n=1 Tax=Rhodothalassium salexigens DSM 2132 TaxID=1188247 RepID=A0A4R2PPN4_RHOSA|nr:crotonase/enoyl-CoA hydratase family protein [Rhodothalassium salexigens]MBB4210838.1 enoyl-CoA hydratase [Rhodothalassium salexigens DSM 2132]MBK1640130.1 enoyl-CoA hydratase [Rhodothalassium salexigens DSM 2132]TCP37607.1 enoyl-CoA hydratase [Rhodothalassium salexigens DSM 2132]
MTVRVETADRVTTVTIDRPARRNAVDRATAEALHDAFTAFDRNPAAHVAVLTGAGGAFCAGADLKALAAGDANRLSAEGPAPMGPTRLDLAKPVIAAVEGPAVAGGLELALWCDLRVAARSAVFGVYCRRVGVPLIDLGTVRLPRLIGQSRALDMILTGRAVAADEAERIGLVNRLVDDGQALAAAHALAQDLARLPQTCLRNDRRSALDQWALDRPAAQANEFRLGLATIASGETAQGADAFSAGAGRHGEPL